MQDVGTRAQVNNLAVAYMEQATRTHTSACGRKWKHLSHENIGIDHRVDVTGITQMHCEEKTFDACYGSVADGTRVDAPPPRRLETHHVVPNARPRRKNLFAPRAAITVLCSCCSSAGEAQCFTLGLS